MSLRRTFMVAWEGLTLNKIRSLLTTLGVIIGVAAVIIMLAVSAGAEAEIADQINSLGANLIMVMPSFSRGGFGQGTGRPPGLSYDDILAISENVTGINGVSAEQSTSQDLKSASTTLEGVSVVGTTSGLPDVRDFNVAVGRFISEDDNDRKNKIVVLGANVAVEMFGDVASALGNKIKIGSTQFTVVGIMENKGVVGSTDYDGRVYIPLSVYFDKFSNSRFGGDTVRLVYVSAADRDNVGSVMSQLTELLAIRHDVDPSMPDFQLMTQDSIIDAQASTTEAFRDLLAWVAAISLVVGGIGIMNIMLVSVTERTREIGLRQALGARPRDVRLQFLLEAIVLSLAGGIVGVLVGIGGSYLFNSLGTMRTQLVPESIPLAFAAAAIVGIFFGYYPANQASQLDPIEALRRE
ncbi:MAG: ABC transporter permease [Chloroflexota bacterium]